MRLLLIVAALCTLTACAKEAFKINEKTLAMNQNVLGGGNGTPLTAGGGPGGAGGIGPIKSGGEGGDGGGSVPLVNGNLPIQRFCSDHRTQGVTAANASSLSASITNSTGTVVCNMSDTATLRTALQSGYLPTSNCSLPDGSYSTQVIANGSVEIAQSSGRFTLTNGNVSGSLVSVIVDTNPNLNISSIAYLGTTCDAKGSPLFVDFRKDSSDFDILSSPSEGVLFDILGANGTPAYSKRQISWFTKGKFALLALPNEHGEVLNIDQLFGNNTLGKDGKFADNGFDALAKYDSNHDGVIDRADAVFSKLRLWFDVNRDGQASKKELRTLEEMGIIAIDLNYDHRFSEVDKYGNEVKYKSVVKFNDGKLKSIFDVWFKL